MSMSHLVRYIMKYQNLSHIKCLSMDRVLLKYMKHNGSVKYTIARTKQDLLQK